MPLRIDVDDHQPQEASRENSLTVAGAIKNAFKDSNERLRPQSDSDSVTVNGKPSSYRSIISREDGDNARIDVETECYKAEKSAKADDPRRLLRRAANKAR